MPWRNVFTQVSNSLSISKHAIIGIHITRIGLHYGELFSVSNAAGSHLCLHLELEIKMDREGYLCGDRLRSYMPGTDELARLDVCLPEARICVVLCEADGVEGMGWDCVYRSG
jgi:hypothetical protein